MRSTRLVDWYATAPKSDSHAPAPKENDREATEAGKEGEGGAGGAEGAGRVSELSSMD